MRAHLHTDVVHVLYFGFGTIVLIHVLRIVAANLSKNDSTVSAGKVLGAFALGD